VYAVILALFALQTVANVQLWRTCDEFLRKQMLTVCAITFAVGQGALFLWAAAEQLHLARAISSWDILTLMLTLYICTGAILGLRNRAGQSGT
jgi:hypothetical protein